jgi:hypothetical protein
MSSTTFVTHAGPIPGTVYAKGVVPKPILLPLRHRFLIANQPILDTYFLLTNQLGVDSSGMICPQCSSKDCWRATRRGWRDFMWRLLRHFPWRCKRCGHRFYRFRRR